VKVKVITAGALTHSLPEGRDSIEGENLTLGGVLNTLVEKYGAVMAEELLFQGNLRNGLAVLLNGRNVLSLPLKFETALKEGDEILISLIVAGG
jgi:molybdopterin converting factor small subunit